MSLNPSARDVDVAYQLAMADLIDWRRCENEYGRGQEVTRIAKEAYFDSETYWRQTKDRYEALPHDKKRPR